MNNNQDSFLQIVQLGIGHYAIHLAGEFDWTAIKALAEQQGLSAIIIDGVDKLSEHLRPPKQVLLQWIGETLQGYEYRYEMYQQAITELANWHNTHGYKMMVLKGYACSLNWPKPNHRPCGDIDIWQFGEQKNADELLTSEKGIKVDNSHHHHTVFSWRDFTVENHYDFVNVHSRKSNAVIEKIFKDFGEDDSHFVTLNNQKVYIPSPNLHALFLLKHSMGNFVSTSITIRQVLDWAFFVEKHTKEVDWEWLMGVLRKFHMMDFYNIISAICVEDLGFEASIFPIVQFKPDLKDKVLKDILYPKYSASEPSRLIPRLLYKYRRWQGNAWKQELCYSESRWSAFWSGVWGHLLKPKSI